MELNSYLEQLEEQIRNRKAKAEVIEEIRNHIEDQAEFYEKEGMSAEEAIEQAVRQMGDPVEVGIEMDRIHRPKPGAPLFLLAFMMSVAGLLTQYFSFYRFGEELVVYQRVIDNAFARQCVYVLMGTAVMLVILCVDYSPVGRHGKKNGSLAAGGTVYYLPVSAWLSWQSFLPEKPYLSVCPGVWRNLVSEQEPRVLRNSIQSFFWLAAAFWIAAARIGGGLGITIVMACVCYIMMTAAVIKGWFNENRKAGIVLTAGIIPVSAVIAVLAQLQPYQIKRIEVLFHPERYAQGAGYQAARTREVIEGLTMFGTGGVKPEQLPIHMLPGVQDDYILLQVASVYGIIAACLLVGLLAVFLFCLFRMIYKQKNRLGKIVGYGCLMVIAAEIAGNLMINFGFYTISTGGLPFFSYGGYHTVTIYVLLGVIFSIHRYQNLAWEREDGKNKQEKGVLAHLGKYRIRIERCR
ncbi:MAG: FtsW/RodA/SpoVE family cell cycle protein [[Clostridium] symbiosum]